MGSNNESAAAIDMPPMLAVIEGKKSNWWAWDTGTVLIEINCADPGAANNTSIVDRERERPIIRHLALREI